MMPEMRMSEAEGRPVAEKAAGKTTADIFVRLYTAAVKSGFFAAISDRDWKTLCVIALYMNDQGQCYPSRHTIAQALGVTASTASERIQSLLRFRWHGQPVMEVARERRSNGTLGRQTYTILPCVPLRFGHAAAWGFNGDRFPKLHENEERGNSTQDNEDEAGSESPTLEIVQDGKRQDGMSHLGTSAPLITRSGEEQDPDINESQKTTIATDSSRTVWGEKPLSQGESLPHRLGSVLQTMVHEMPHESALAKWQNLKDGDLVEGLRACGIPSAVAHTLSQNRKQTLRVLHWVAMMPTRESDGRPRNVPGWVRQAIIEEWTQPPHWVVRYEKQQQQRQRQQQEIARQRQQRQRQQQEIARQRQERQEDKQRQDQIAKSDGQRKQWWQQLSYPEKQRLWDRAFREEPEALRQALVRSRGDDIDNPGPLWLIQVYRDDEYST